MHIPNTPRIWDNWRPTWPQSPCQDLKCLTCHPHRKPELVMGAPVKWPGSTYFPKTGWILGERICGGNKVYAAIQHPDIDGKKTLTWTLIEHLEFDDNPQAEFDQMVVAKFL